MTAYQGYSFSGYIQGIGYLLFTWMCFYRFHFRSSYVKILGIYAGGCLFFNILQFMFLIVPGLKSGYAINIVGNVFILFETVTLLVFYFVVLQNPIDRKIIKILSFVYVIFYGAVFFFTPFTFSLIRSGREIMMMTASLLYFYHLLKRSPSENLFQMPMFWIASAIFFHFSGTFILSLSIDFLVKFIREDVTAYLAFRNFFRFFFVLILFLVTWFEYRLSIKT